MEPLVETIDLDIEESNDLTFKIRLEGTSTAPAKVRLVCEGKDFSYMFNGYGTNEPETVQFTLPQMNNRLQEGLYNARVEVLVENRYFSPLHFQINFKKTLSVVAESIQVVQKPAKQELKVTAVPVIAAAAKQTPVQVIKFEQKPEVKTEQTSLQNQTPQAQPVAQQQKSSLSLKEKFSKKGR
jgi:hypothetical protein